MDYQLYVFKYVLTILIWSLKCNILATEMPCLVLSYHQGFIKYLLYVSVLDYRGEWVQFTQRYQGIYDEQNFMRNWDSFLGSFSTSN